MTEGLERSFDDLEGRTLDNIQFHPAWKIQRPLRCDIKANGRQSYLFCISS